MLIKEYLLNFGSEWLRKIFNENCDLCGKIFNECKKMIMDKKVSVRCKTTGCHGVAEDKGSHIEVIFSEGKVVSSSHYAKCIFYRDYVILKCVH